MAITTAEYDFKVKVTETPALGIDGVSNPEIVYQIETTLSSGSVTPTTSVPATTQWQDQRTLSAGADAIDLTALTDGNLPTKNLNGLKIQLVKVVASTNNTDTITIRDHTTNGYFICGDSSGQVTLPIGGRMQLYGHDGMPDVSATAKQIAVTSSDVDAVYTIQVVAG